MPLSTYKIQAIICIQTIHYWAGELMEISLYNCIFLYSNWSNTQTQTCGPSRERRWRRQVVLSPHWCCSCGVVDTSQTDETDRGSHRAGSFQHRCLFWGGGAGNCIYMTPQESLEYIIPPILFESCNEIAAKFTCLVINTATSWWAGCVSLWGLRFFCQAQKLARVVSAWWTIFNPFCNQQQNCILHSGHFWLL